MSPLVVAAMVAGGTTIATTLISLWMTRAAQRTQNKQVDNTARIDEAKLRLDIMAELVDSMHEELVRKDNIIEELRNALEGANNEKD